MKLSDLKNTTAETVNTPDKHGKTPVTHAVEKQKYDMFMNFVDMGGNINVKNNSGMNLLHYAARKSDIRFAEYLVGQGIDVNAKNAGGVTPLFEACNKCETEMAAYLVDAGAKLEVKDLNEETPLIRACLNGDAELVALLLKKGADPNNIGNFSPLERAIWAESPEVAQVLFDAVADILKHQASVVKTFAWREPSDVQLSMLKQYIDMGLQVDLIYEKYEYTLLANAARIDSVKLCKLLIEAGADKTLRSGPMGERPIDLAKSGAVKKLLA